MNSAARASSSTGSPSSKASTRAQGRPESPAEPAADPPKALSPVSPPRASKLSGWPKACCHSGAASKPSGRPGSARSARGRSRTENANGTNSARLGRSAHHTVRPRRPRSTPHRATMATDGTSSDGAAAVTTASARPAAAAAVHEGVPLMPGRAAGLGVRRRWPGAGTAWTPCPAAVPVARSSARTSTGIMTCASSAPSRPWLRATWSAGAPAQTRAAARRSLRRRVRAPAANHAPSAESGMARISSQPTAPFASPAPSTPSTHRT